MATLISRSSGNFTASATWCVCSPAAELASENTTGSSSTSYVATSAFAPGDVIVNGWALKISSRTNAGTTVTDLYNVSTSTSVGEISCLNTLLPGRPGDASVGWAVFTLNAPVALSANNAYQIRARTTSAGSITFWRQGATQGYSRQLITTTNAAPSSNDILIIAGEILSGGITNSFNVTMDNTNPTLTIGNTLSAQSISINQYGTLSYETSASKNYYLRVKGITRVHSGGLFTIGTSANRMPASSTAVFELSCAANVDSGIYVGYGGIFNAYGNNSMTNIRSLLTVDVSAGATTFTVVSTGGWSVGDLVFIEPTNRTITEHERKTITNIIDGTRFSVASTASAAYTHSGTAPTQGYVGHLTRNVKLRGSTTALQGYLYCDALSQAEIDNCEISKFGSNASNRRGIEFNSASASFLTNCAIYDCGVTGSCSIIGQGNSNTDNLVIANNNYYSMASYGILGSAVSPVPCNIFIRNNLFCSTVVGTGNGMNVSDVGLNITDNIASGTGVGFAIAETAGNIVGVISGNVAHTNSVGGFSFGGITSGTIYSCYAWRNTGYGVSTGTGYTIIDGLTAFGNSSSNLQINGGYSIWKNVIADAGATYTCPIGLQITTGGIFQIENSSFGVPTPHSTGDLYALSLGYFIGYLYNCTLSSSVPVANQLNSCREAFIGSINTNNNPSNNKTFYASGSASSDYSIFDTTAPSLRLTPMVNTSYLSSPVIKIPVSSGSSYTPSVKVRHSVSGDGAAYNGGVRAKLKVKTDYNVGIFSDLTLATATSASDGAWETISGTTPTLTADGFIECYVECIGTAGWVNVDTFTAPTASSTLEFGKWSQTQYLVIGNNSTGSGTPVSPAWGGIM